MWTETWYTSPHKWKNHFYLALDKGGGSGSRSGPNLHREVTFGVRRPGNWEISGQPGSSWSGSSFRWVRKTQPCSCSAR